MGEMNELTAEAVIEFANRKYRSELERVYAEDCSFGIYTCFDSEVLVTHYEPFTFNLPGKIKYTPDFLHVLKDRRMILVEVKNSKKQKGYRVTRNKLVTAASLYPFFVWAETLMESPKWNFEIIEPKPLSIEPGIQ